MPKTTQNILVEDFYRTSLTSDVAESGDLEIAVTTPPIYKKGFIIVSPDSTANRERMYYDDVIGNIIYIKGVNRVNPQAHSSGDKVQINDTSLIFNYLSELNATAFFTEKISPLVVKIWGGPLLSDTGTISVEDTEITLDDGSINYIYYKISTNEIKSSTSEATTIADNGVITSQITTASGTITDIAYRNYKFTLPTPGPQGPPGASGSGIMDSVVGSAYIIIDNTDPANPIISLKDGDISINGIFTANAFVGDGSGITNIQLKAKSLILDYMLGETSIVGRAYSLVDYKQLVGGTDNNFGSVAQPEVAQSFYAQDKDINTIDMMIKKISSPSDGIFVEIQESTAGLPNGTVVTNGTSAIIDYTILSATSTKESFVFASVPELTVGSVYHIVLKRTGSADILNFYSIESAGSDVQIGTMSIDTGTWANTPDDLFFEFDAKYKLAVLGGDNFVGICQSVGLVGEIKPFNTNYDDNQSGLIPGSYYGYNPITGIIDDGSSIKAISETEISFNLLNQLIKNTQERAVTGETIIKGRALRLGRYEEGISNIDNLLGNVIVNHNTATFLTFGQTFTTTNQIKINQIGLDIYRIGNPSGTMVCTLYEDDTKATILGVSNTYNCTDVLLINDLFNFVFPTIADVSIATAGYYYEISFSNQPAHTPANFIGYGLYDNAYSGGAAYENSTLAGNDLRFTVYGKNILIDEDNTKVYYTDATDPDKINFIGFANKSVGIGEVVDINISGVDDNQSGLTIDNLYFLKNGGFQSIVDGVPIQQLVSSPGTYTSGYFGSIDTSKTGQTFVIGNDFILRNITVGLRKVSSPSSNIVMKIYASNKTTLLATSSNTITGAGLTTSFVNQIFNFNDFALNPNTSYFFEISHDGVDDNANYYITQIYDGNIYLNGSSYYFDGIWKTFGRDKVFDIIMGVGGYVAGEISTSPGDNPLKIGRSISDKSIIIYDGAGELTVHPTSSVLKTLADAASGVNNTWVQLRVETIHVSGIYRVSGNLNGDTGGGTCFSRVYKNGIPHPDMPQVNYNDTNSGIDWNQTGYFADGDTLEIWGHDAGDTAFLSELTVYGSLLELPTTIL